MRFADDEDDDKIKFQAWGSFFLLEKNKEYEAGVKFFGNMEFGEEDKRAKDDRADEYGPISIPNVKSFWCILNKKGIYMLSSRRDSLTKFKHFTSFKSLKMNKAGTPALKDLG